MEKIKKPKFSKLRLAATSNNINNSEQFVSSQISKFFHKDIPSTSTNLPNITVNSNQSIPENLPILKETEDEEVNIVTTVSSTINKLDKTAEKIKLIKKRKKIDSKSTITKFLNTNNEESFENDFEKPKKPKIVPKIKKKPKPRLVKSRNQTDIRNIIKQNQCTDEERLYKAIIAQSALENVDPEQFIYSVALSRSLADSNNVQNESDNFNGDSSSNNLKSTQERALDIQQTLEKFGFRNKNGFTEDDFHKISQIQNYKARKKQRARRKYDKFHYKTVEEKVEILLINEYQNDIFNGGCIEPYQMISNYLLDYYSPQKSLFKIQSLEYFKDLNIENFYTGNLFKPSTIKAGHLLKNWSKIPGRDKSPIQLLQVSDDTSIVNSELVDTIDDVTNIEKLTMECCTPPNPQVLNDIKLIKSPDLFAFSDSDDDEKSKDIIEIESSESYSTAKSSLVSSAILDVIIHDVNLPNIGEFVETTTQNEKKNTSNCDLFNETSAVIDLTQTNNIDLDKMHENILSISSTDSFQLEIPYVSINRALLSPQMSIISEELENKTNSFVEITQKINEKTYTQNICSSEMDSDNSNINVLSLKGNVSNIFDLSDNDRSLSSQHSIYSISSDNDSTILDYDYADQIYSNKLHKKDITFNLNEIKTNSDIINSKNDDEYLIHENEKTLLEESFITDVGDLNNINVLNDSINDMFNNTRNNSIIVNNNNKQNSSSLNKTKELRRHKSESFLTECLPIESNINYEKVDESSEDEFDKLVSAGNKRTEKNISTINLSECELNEIGELSSDENVENMEIIKTLSQQDLILNNNKTYDLNSDEKYIYKTRNVTPKPNYQNMSLDVLCKELEKFGIKQLSKRRAIMLLEYIYNQTHPSIDLSEDDDHDDDDNENHDMNITLSQPTNSITNLEIKYGIRKKTNKKVVKKHNTNKSENNNKKSEIELNLNEFNFAYVDADVNILEDDGFSYEPIQNEEYILPSKPKVKIHSCQLPLQIAFYNLIKSNSKFKRQILFYEPFELENLNEYFNSIGLKYETNDLKSFLDRRCITFRNVSRARTQK